jgi:hypothetical protein
MTKVKTFVTVGQKHVVLDRRASCARDGTNFSIGLDRNKSPQVFISMCWSDDL